MIHLTNIEKSFGSLEVLKGIDLEINKGEVVSIVGPSGAGKTTLLQIMGTLDRPDSGKVIVDGVDVSTLSQKKLSDFRNQHVGFVFQFHQLLPEFTALENIMIPAFIAGKSQKEAKRRALELLAFGERQDGRSEHRNDVGDDFDHNRYTYAVTGGIADIGQKRANYDGHKNFLDILSHLEGYRFIRDGLESGSVGC